MKNVLKVLSVVFCFMFFLNGCAQVTELSEEDETRIAVYSARVIGKFNKNMRRGIVPVVMVEKPEFVKGEEQTESESGFPLNPLDVNAPTSDGGVSDLTNVIAMEGISVSYTDTVISTDAGADGGFLISPQTGNSFVTVYYTITNTTEGDIQCNLRDKGMFFQASLGGVVSVNDRTLLPDDLALYNDLIPAGGSVRLGVLFQFPTQYVSDLSGLEIACVKDGVKYQVPF